MNKNEYVKEMIRNAIRKENEKKLPAFRAQPNIIAMCQRVRMHKKTLQNAEKELERILKNNGFSLAYDSTSIQTLYSPPFPDNVIKRLELAQRLSQLGKFNESRKIYDELIKQYNLDKVN